MCLLTKLCHTNSFTGIVPWNDIKIYINTTDIWIQKYIKYWEFDNRVLRWSCKDSKEFQVIAEIILYSWLSISVIVVWIEDELTFA